MGIFGGRDHDERDTPKPAPHERPGNEFLQYLPGYQNPKEVPDALPSPQERAVEAFNRGDRFLQIEVPYAEVSAQAGLWIYPVNKGDVYLQSGSADVLGEIEEIGWRLEHANWVFMETGQSSRNKFLTTGQHTVTQGEVIGIYLFRRDQTPCDSKSP